jgi:L-fuconolactonase
MSFPQLRAGRDEPILDPEIAIVDSHQHLFQRPTLRYLFDDYLADTNAGHRIIASVYVETQAFARARGPEWLRPLGEIEFANGIGAMSASGAFGDSRICAAIVGYADLRLGDQLGDYLDRALALAPDRFRGLRQIAVDHPTEAPYRYIAHRPPRGLFKHPEIHNSLRQVARRGLVFDVAAFHTQLPDVIPLADAFPETCFVINHCGHAILMDTPVADRPDVFRLWRATLAECARRPNIICKIGGLGLPFWGFGLEERTDPIGYMELASIWKPWVETTIELFGADRCMMESNYPPDSRSAGFVPLWNAMKYLVRSASESEKAAMFRDTAVRVYRIELQAV